MAKLLTYPLRAFLDISTGHLKISTRNYLEKMFDDTTVGIAHLIGNPTEDGWFLYCADDEYLDGIKEDSFPEVPEDLLTCLYYGRNLGCDYLLFDRDAEPVLNAQGNDLAIPYYGDSETAVPFAA